MQVVAADAAKVSQYKNLKFKVIPADAGIFMYNYCIF